MHFKFISATSSQTKTCDLKFNKMKTILFILTSFFLNSLVNAQSQAKVGYNFNYEVSIDPCKLSESDPKLIVIDFIDHIFSQQDEKFNLQTRYSESGTFYISSNSRIEKSTVEKYFTLKRTELLSFKENIDLKDKNIHVNFALN